MHYIKIDLEGYDTKILNDLFSNHIYPDYISAEFQSIDVFAQLITSDKYKAFKLGDKVKNNGIYDHKLKLSGVMDKNSGRFGNDIPGDWLNMDSFFYYLAARGPKGIGIHATLLNRPNLSINPEYQSINFQIETLKLDLKNLMLLYKHINIQIMIQNLMRLKQICAEM